MYNFVYSLSLIVNIKKACDLFVLFQVLLNAL